jgi:transposase
MQTCGHTPEWTGGPIVERTMRNGKRIYATAFKNWLVEQARLPGASVSGLALRHGINANLLRHWMQLDHWSTPAAQAALLPVTVTLPAPALPPVSAPVHSVPAAPIEIVLGGTIVRVPAGVDAQHLRLVLEAVRA